MVISYVELAYMILKAEKSHDLLSASWRCREANGIILCESKGLRTREANYPWAGEEEAMRCPSSTVKQKKKRKTWSISPSSTISPILALSGLDNAHPHWRGQSTLLSPPIQILISSRNTLTDTARHVSSQQPKASQVDT